MNDKAPLTESEIKDIKTFNILSNFFIVLMAGDFLIRIILGSWLYAYSSGFLFAGLCISKIFVRQYKLDMATMTVAMAFYIDAYYLTYILGEYITSYFIFIVAPILCAILLTSLRLKILTLIISTVSFMACNYLSGLPLLSNYFFFFGLYPSFVAMLYFSHRLKKLTADKNALIDELKYKNEELILFSNMMSHDLKAPLNNIHGFASLLEKKLTNLGSREESMLKHIITSAKSMSVLIKDLLDYFKTRDAEWRFKEINLDKLVDEVTQSLQYQVNEKQAVINKKNLTTIHANHGGMTNLFQNLISNSIKYQPIDQPNHIPLINIEQIEDADKYHIIISDNGIGIEKEYIDRLFKPFARFSSKAYKGTGLGLFTCKQIMEKHGGKIAASSSIGEGTTFTITLPKMKSGTDISSHNGQKQKEVKRLETIN